MKRTILWQLVMGWLCLAVLNGGPVDATEVTLEEISAASYEKIAHQPHYVQLAGVLLVDYAPQGKLFVHVTGKVVVRNWSREEAGSFAIPVKEIKLVAAGGQGFPLIGSMLGPGKFDTHLSDLRFSRLASPEFDVVRPIGLVFLVPRDFAGGTLHIGEHTAKIPKTKVTANPPPSSIFEAEVVAAHFVEQLTSQRNVAGGGTISQTYRAAEGKLLAVEVKLTGLRSNTASPQSYAFHTIDFGLSIAGKSYTPAAATKFGNGIASNAGSAPNLGQTADTTLYFVVPTTLSKFQLTYLGAPIAAGEVK